MDEQSPTARDDELGTTRPRFFISVAAYRDPEFLPTIEDCLAKARFPERLRFGICLQDEPAVVLPALFRREDRFHLIRVDWRESRGACWARAEIMNLWAGEDWYLQLDSHHRFVEHWDEKLLRQATLTASPKPVLTTYATPYSPGDHGRPSADPMMMSFDRFTEDGIPLFRPAPIPDSRRSAGPVRSRFMSAHFLFAPGTFVEEVPYDPELYFLGEEITLTVRAFTNGYDFFHPSEVIVWHEYTRSHRRKHWDDHLKTNGVTRDWYTCDIQSRKKVRQLLTARIAGRFGVGAERTLADYEAFAGISLRACRSQAYTRADLEPPNPPLERGWEDHIHLYRIDVRVDAGTLPADRERANFMYVGFADCDGNEIFRQDADWSEIDPQLEAGRSSITIERQFEASTIPACWTIWWCGADGSWCDDLYFSGPLTLDAAEPRDDQRLVTGSGALPVPGSATRLPPLVGEANGAGPSRLDGGGPRLTSVRPVTADGVSWIEHDGQLVLTEPSGRASLLNDSAALIVALADGEHSVAQIARVLADAYALSEEPIAEVATFLTEAVAAGLIETTWSQKGGSGDG